MRITSCLAAVCFLLGPAVSACAQDAGLTPRPPLFLRLFPHSTGLNGYEDLVMAGDLACDNKPLGDTFMPEATLTQKRAAMREPAVVQAMKLLKQGLNKQILPPKGPATELSFEVYASFRQLGRMLMIDEYVQCADGYVSEAIDDLRDGLRLSYVVAGDRMIGGLVSVAIDAMVIRTMRERMDQLSQRDCVRMMDLAREWLRTPDPAITALTNEKSYAIAEYRKLSGDSATIVQVCAAATVYFDRAIDNLRLPKWQRKPVQKPDVDENTTVGGLKLVDIMAGVMGQATDKFVVDQALVQMLGVHAAIRNYRWEHNRLPESLDVLKLGDLGVDPFSGKPLIYRKTSDTTYELSSSGIDDRGRLK